jgi:hypothetical protein
MKARGENPQVPEPLRAAVFEIDKVGGVLGRPVEAAGAFHIVRMTGKNDSGPFNDHLMMIHFWVKQGGAWKLAAHQTTKIP